MLVKNWFASDRANGASMLLETSGGEVVANDGVQALIDAMAAFGLDNGGYDPYVDRYASGEWSNDAALINAVQTTWT